MKKFFAALVVCAACCSARAVVPWTWTISVNDVTDDARPSTLSVFLVDPRQKYEVLSYLTMSDVKPSTEVPGSMVLKTAPTTHTELPVAAQGQGLKMSDGHDINSAMFTVSLQDNKLYNYHLTAQIVPSSLMDTVSKYSSLQAIVAYTLVDETTGKEVPFYQQIVAKTADPTSHEVSFATTFNPIPEPTSGMLMLLGFAGLALKRKRI